MCISWSSEYGFLGRDLGNIRIFHLYGNWTSKTWRDRDWRKTRENAKWKTSNVHRSIHSSVHGSPIFLLHGVAQSKKGEGRFMKRRDKFSIPSQTIKTIILYYFISTFFFYNPLLNIVLLSSNPFQILIHLNLMLFSKYLINKTRCAFWFFLTTAKGRIVLVIWLIETFWTTWYCWSLLRHTCSEA